MRRNIRLNRGAALEGLPLYLIILVVIAAVAIVVIMGWMGTLQKAELDEIEITLRQDGKDVTDLDADVSASVTVLAIDQNGKPLEDVTINIEGAGQDAVKITSNTGKATFSFTPTLPTNENNGIITVTATYSGGNLDLPVSKDIVVNA
jgi:hypothetical protein